MFTRALIHLFIPSVFCTLDFELLHFFHCLGWICILEQNDSHSWLFVMWDYCHFQSKQWSAESIYSFNIGVIINAAPWIKAWPRPHHLLFPLSWPSPHSPLSFILLWMHTPFWHLTHYCNYPPDQLLIDTTVEQWLHGDSYSVFRDATSTTALIPIRYDNFQWQIPLRPYHWDSSIQMSFNTLFPTKHPSEMD